MNGSVQRVVLRHQDAVAEIALQGGELRRWCIGDHELLWNADPLWWPRSSPLLFPIVGRLRGGQTRVNGRVYAMGIHGFAGDQAFALQSVQADQVMLSLDSNDATRAMYPFEFELGLRYRVQGDALEIALRVHNLGAKPMPYALGLHPGLRWPFSAAHTDGHAVVFDLPESPLVPVITADGLFSDRQHALDMAPRRLGLDPSPIGAEALCFLNANSRCLRFESPDGAAIALTASNFAHWALWNKPGAPFLCIEAWTGHGDSAGFDGELADRPSMRQLAPGATSGHGLTLRFERAARS